MGLQINKILILCEWISAKIAYECLQKNRDLLFNWMKDIKIWNKDHSPLGRSAWLELEGIPVRAWHREAIESMVSQFGKVVEVDDVNLDMSLLHTTGVPIHSFIMEEIKEVRL